MSLWGWAALCLFAAAAARAVRGLPLARWTDFWIAWMVVLTGALVVTGQVLSLLKCLSNPLGWLAAAGIGTLIARRLARGPAAGKPPWPDLKAFKQDLTRTTGFNRAAFTLLAAAVVLATALNLTSLATCRPTNWDSIASHLTRAAYFLQFDSLAAFDANYWAHDAHAHNAAILWVFVLGILKSEILTQAVQFVFYLGGGLVVYGLGRAIFGRRLPAAMGALIFLLLVENLLEAISVQNDLVLHFFSGAALYFLLCDDRRAGQATSWLAAAAMFLAVGVKATAVMHLPVWGAVTGFLAVRNRIRHRGRPTAPRRHPKVLTAALAAVLFQVVFLGDGIGYLTNLRAYGHPIAPAVARDRSFEGIPAGDAIREGAKNLLRYGVDGISPDGLNRVPGVSATAVAVKRRLVDAVHAAGVALSGGRMHLPFAATPPTTDEDFSGWGIMGALLIPLAAARWLFVRSGGGGAAGWALLSAGAVYILTQAFIGPYEPWRGRYFLFLALLWAPFTGSFFVSGRLAETAGRLSAARHAMAITGRLLLAAVLALGVVSAVMAAAWRDVRPITLGFSGDRITQMTARFKDPAAAELFRRFDAIVPPAASVAVCLPGDFYEYLLFGEGLSRRLTPIRHRQAFQESFGAPDYLFYHYDGSAPLHLCPPSREDRPLGRNYFLRRLSGQAPAPQQPAGSGIAAPAAAVNRLGMRFAQIPAGTYRVGSPADEPGHSPWEAPFTAIISRPVFMQTTEVTRRQWSAVMGPAPAFPADCPECPVNGVSWEDIQPFIRLLNGSGIGTYRLPTEAEWEIAARAGSDAALANGDIGAPEGPDARLEEIGWYAGNSAGRPWPVGSLAPNARGFYDMHGNVWEWCADGYGRYPSAVAVDPRGDPASAVRVVRGGSFDNWPVQCRSAVRNGFSPGHRAGNLGFRLVYTPP